MAIVVINMSNVNSKLLFSLSIVVVVLISCFCFPHCHCDCCLLNIRICHCCICYEVYQQHNIPVAKNKSYHWYVAILFSSNLASPTHSKNTILTPRQQFSLCFVSSTSVRTTPATQYWVCFDNAILRHLYTSNILSQIHLIIPLNYSTTKILHELCAGHQHPDNSCDTVLCIFWQQYFETFVYFEFGVRDSPKNTAYPHHNNNNPRPVCPQPTSGQLPPHRIRVFWQW